MWKKGWDRSGLSEELANVFPDFNLTVIKGAGTAKAYKKILKKYLKSTQNPQSLTKNTRKVDLNTDSKVLTLSTCTNGAANTRYLVQGVLIKDEQTK